MNCINCGGQVSLNAKFCGKCGKAIVEKPAESPTTTGSVKKKSAGNWILWWQIGEDELKKQIDNYDNFFKSARGESVLLIGFSLVITLVTVFVSWVDSSALYDVTALVILGIFIGLGHRWAIIGAMILWTIEKGYQLLGGTNAVVVLIWWAIYMHAFWLAYKVEAHRAEFEKLKTKLGF